MHFEVGNKSSMRVYKTLLVFHVMGHHLVLFETFSADKSAKDSLYFFSGPLLDDVPSNFCPAVVTGKLTLPATLQDPRHTNSFYDIPHNAPKTMSS